MMKMSLRNSTYHRVLRVSGVVLALMLLFESGIVHESTAALSLNTHAYLANVIGMSASVEPNELNVITAELTAQKLALDSREAALREREIAVDLNGGGASNENATYVIAGLLFVLLVLIVINYGLDFLRAREQRLLQTRQPV